MNASGATLVATGMLPALLLVGLLLDEHARLATATRPCFDGRGAALHRAPDAAGPGLGCGSALVVASSGAMLTSGCRFTAARWRAVRFRAEHATAMGKART